MNKLYHVLLLLTFLPCLLQAQITITLQPDATAGKDAFVAKHEGNSSWETTNYGNEAWLYAEVGQSGGDDIYKRFFIDFDVDQIPKGAYIESATLYLYSGVFCCPTGHDNSTNSNASWIERVTEQWYEDSITWNNQPISDPTNRAEIQEESNVSADHEIDVTALYQEIINQDISGRHGVKIYLKNESPSARLLYHSSDESLATDRPKLVITYNTAPPYCFHWLGDCDVTGTTFNQGKVAINTDSVPSGYLMAVNGKVVCEDVLIEYDENWPDFIFEEDYRLTDLYELAEFIKTYRHLPELPSEASIQKQGVPLGKMSALQLEKVEELLLYVIEQRKLIKELEEKIKELENQ